MLVGALLVWIGVVVALRVLSGGGAWQMTAIAGVPALAPGFAWSLLVLGTLRFLQSFKDTPSGGFLDFVMSVLALHVMAWARAGLAQWAWSARRGRKE